MENIIPIDKTENLTLLKQFNSRSVQTFGEVYSLLHSELIFFANRLFLGTPVSGEDIVQDIFVAVWEDKRKLFPSIDDIKGYIYASIKNKFKNHIKHSKYVEKYQKTILEDDSNIISIAETEVFSIISRALEVLPEECAKVFKLHLEGWNIKDIASQLNKSESTVYKQRQLAINCLSKKFSPTDLSIFLSLFF